MPEALRRTVLANFDSTIVSVSQHACLKRMWAADGPVTDPPELTLLYRASRDGWNASDFHSKCDNKGPTLTVIKCTGGYVFGGYAHAAWTPNGSWQTSPGSFLFSLVSPSGMGPVKMMLKNNNDGNAMYCHPSYGPTFGGGHDIHVCSNANSSSGSCTSLGNSYHLPDGQSSETFFTGQHNFQAAEVEVFSVP